jgi:AhpD family alkylhydroperoxidase
MTNVVMVLPEAFQALQALNKSAENAGVPRATLELVHLRASQINGCSVCVDMHPRFMRKAGEAEERILAVSAWRDTPYFSDAERAALALTEAVTRIADREEAVSDAVWNEAARHYDERALAGLLVAIGAINVWNRLNGATRQMSLGKAVEEWNVA